VLGIRSSVVVFLRAMRTSFGTIADTKPPNSSDVSVFVFQGTKQRSAIASRRE